MSKFTKNKNEISNFLIQVHLLDEPFGPGGLNASRIQRQLDEGSYETNLPYGQTLYNPVSLKGYKYNKRFNP